MNYLRLENEILSSVQNLNGTQKTNVLAYIKTMEPSMHSTRIYRRKAMKQIREALANI